MWVTQFPMQMWAVYAHLLLINRFHPLHLTVRTGVVLDSERKLALLLPRLHLSSWHPLRCFSIFVLFFRTFNFKLDWKKARLINHAEFDRDLTLALPRPSMMVSDSSWPILNTVGSHFNKIASDEFPHIQRTNSQSPS